MNFKLSQDQIDSYFNEVYAKDENGKYINLKFSDYEGEISFVGKADSELNIDEIVRLKKSVEKFYEIFDNISNNEVESIKLASNILEIPFTEIVFYTIKLENGLLYISISSHDKSIIIDPTTKEYLFMSSSIDKDTHLQKFLNGERS